MIISHTRLRTKAKFKIIAASFAIITVLGQPAFAEDTPESRLQVAQKLVEETVTSSLVENMTASVWPPIENDIRSRNPNIDDAALEELRMDFETVQKQQMAELVVDMPGIYAKYFTTDELTKILEFQTSEVGRKALSVTPKLMAEFMPKIIQSLQTQMPMIMERFNKRLSEKGFKI